MTLSEARADLVHAPVPFAELDAATTGTVAVQGSEGYDDLVSPWNLAIPVRPAAVVAKPKKPASAPRSASRAAPVVRHVTTTIGATALAQQFEAEPAVRYQLRPVEDVVVPISRRLSLVQLSERTCKWPNGDPLTEDFSFCGNDSADSGPYCTYHARLAFQPAAERRRSR